VREVGVTLTDRIHAKVDKRGADDCWPWTGRLSEGYGVIDFAGRPHRVSRLVLAAHLGRPLRFKFLACHTCDNRLCCNPAHLYEGTHADNNADTRARGPWAPPPRLVGAQAPHARLSESDIPVIRARIAAGDSHRAIAAVFGVTYGAIGGIATGKNWRTVA
jgi:hypothetical protein